MTELLTKAGRALLESPNEFVDWYDGFHIMPSAILAIEREAAALDVERLAVALIGSDLIRRYQEYAFAAYPTTMRPEPNELAKSWAKWIADAYARLTAAEAASDE